VPGELLGKCKEVLLLIQLHSGWLLGKKIIRKSGEALEWAAQGGGGVTVPGRCGTEGRG